VLVQYGLYLSRLVHGDLGRSIVTHEPVISEFRTLFPATIELSVCAILFALCLGLPAGIIAAVRRNSIFDHGVMGDLAHRIFDADLLVGIAADPAFFRAAWMDSGIGPDRGAILHRTGHRLPADRCAAGW
jgi:ABC-type microcin C transport system permease subunit YejB